VDSIRLFFFFLTLAWALCLLLGLYKPWWVLWWEDVQNRKKVLWVYGTSMLASWLVYEALSFLGK
jgi:hypothetical protein